MSATLNDADLSRRVEQLKRKMPSAIKRALSRTATSATAVASRLIAEDTGLPVRRVKDAIQVVWEGNTTVRLTTSSKRIPLIDFKAKGPEPSRGKGRGVSYSLPGGRGRLSSGFIATMPGGHRGVFTRVGEAVRRGRNRAWLPIQEKFGPSLVNVFKKFLPIAEKQAQETLVANLRHELDFASKRS